MLRQRDSVNMCQATVKFHCRLKPDSEVDCRYYETAPKLKGKCIYLAGKRECSSPWAKGMALASVAPGAVAIG